MRLSMTGFVMSSLCLLLACSSSSGGGGGYGQCADVNGTWTVDNQCLGLTETCTLSSNACNGSMNCPSLGNVSLGITGNQIQFSPDTGVNCTGTVNGSTLSGTCDTGGGNCTFSGTRVGGGGTGGSGATGGTGATGGSAGSGASGGTGGSAGSGASGGSGGSAGANCGSLYSNDAVCNSCAEANCCANMQQCAPGTACDSLLQCIGTYCSTDTTSECIQTNCPSQLESGGQALLDLFDCVDAACAAQCG